MRDLKKALEAPPQEQQAAENKSHIEFFLFWPTLNQ